MNNSFDVNQYWLKRGQSYVGEKRLANEYHRIQERFLLKVLREGRLPLRKVLELGCGFGRITKLLSENFPDAQITALDLSPDQLANARRHCKGCNNIQFQQYDFYSGAPFPENNYDCAIAIEVFLHHPEPMICALIEKLISSSRFIVNIDWSEAWSLPRPEHVWLHDYPVLYAKAGLQCATFLLPEKVDGKQQKLFVAGRNLPAELIALERQQNQISHEASVPTDADSWPQQLELARAEIAQLVPEDSSFILVNDDQWSDTQAVSGRRAIPFVERDGQYWGPPADDATALRELERLRKAGAAYIVFAWPSFWWLEHYVEFREHLFNSFPCPFHNERLIVFQLS